MWVQVRGAGGIPWVVALPLHPSLPWLAPWENRTLVVVADQGAPRVTTSSRISHQARPGWHTHTITDSEPFRPMLAYGARTSRRSLDARH
ncbi:hypothetical protein BGW80DRAFT_806035 [Lactifluus volemus]|nr:hypothetical protein BGW80DRAFT_806035 [Lactifluus volemus]